MTIEDDPHPPPSIAQKIRLFNEALFYSLNVKLPIKLHCQAVNFGFGLSLMGSRI